VCERIGLVGGGSERSKGQKVRDREAGGTHVAMVTQVKTIANILKNKVLSSHD
jgi:hypothetical protein